jgi:pyruvate/2-oxoglutarate dehydrogenase complex dihydrolipoamide dehydrogenase (E3) component
VELAKGGTRLFTAETIVLSTGSRSFIEGIPGLMEAAPLTHVEALELDEVPGHLIILSGGYIGLEFAQVMRRFGSQVTLIERNERFLHREDNDVSGLLLKVFTAKGIEIVMGDELKESQRAVRPERHAISATGWRADDIKRNPPLGRDRSHAKYF